MWGGVKKIVNKERAILMSSDFSALTLLKQELCLSIHMDGWIKSIRVKMTRKHCHLNRSYS